MEGDSLHAIIRGASGLCRAPYAMAFVAEAVVDLPRDLEVSFHEKRSPNSVVDFLLRKELGVSLCIH